MQSSREMCVTKSLLMEISIASKEFLATNSPMDLDRRYCQRI